MWKKYPVSSRDTDFLYNLVQKSIIQVIKTIASGTPLSNCQLIIRGIEPHQQVDLCTHRFTNLTFNETVDSQSNVNAGPVPVSTSSEYVCIIYVYPTIPLLMG